MKTIKISEAKNKLNQFVKDTIDKMRPILISVSGRKRAVLISLEEYESLKETIEVLKDQGLMKRIAASMKDIKMGKHERY